MLYKFNKKQYNKFRFCTIMFYDFSVLGSIMSSWFNHVIANDIHGEHVPPYTSISTYTYNLHTFIYPQQLVSKSDYYEKQHKTGNKATASR